MKYSHHRLASNIKPCQESSLPNCTIGSLEIVAMSRGCSFPGPARRGAGCQPMANLGMTRHDREGLRSWRQAGHRPPRVDTWNGSSPTVGLPSGFDSWSTRHHAHPRRPSLFLLGQDQLREPRRIVRWMNDPAIAPNPEMDDFSLDPTAPPFQNGDDAATTDGAPADVLLEMRQVAGLTSGTVMPLHSGLFQFRESDRDIGFSLAVQDVDTVMVVPGSVDALVDQAPVTEAMPIGESVLHVGSACFTVRPPRPPATAASIVATIEAARQPTPAIEVPSFIEDQQTTGSGRDSFLSSLFSRQTSETSDLELNAQAWAFLQSIRQTRNATADRHRLLHPNPEELRTRLGRLEPGLWERGVDHPLFGRFAVAYCTIPWEPRFDEPEQIPEELYEPIENMSFLPWVPVTANLLYGPLGIVGSRSAALATARSAVLSLAALSVLGDLEFSIVTSKNLVEDWKWTSVLPPSLFPTDSTGYCVALADGLLHFERAGFSHESVQNNEMGLIVLGESVEDMPDYCGTVLVINDDGTCQVTNHLGERVDGTPIGVTTAFASETGSVITAATSPIVATANE